MRKRQGGNILHSRRKLDGGEFGGRSVPAPLDEEKLLKIQLLIEPPVGGSMPACEHATYRIRGSRLMAEKRLPQITDTQGLAKSRVGALSCARGRSSVRSRLIRKDSAGRKSDDD